MYLVTKFINMGGYGVYVWSAYGIAALVLIGNAIWSKWYQRRTLATLTAWYKRLV